MSGKVQSSNCLHVNAVLSYIFSCLKQWPAQSGTPALPWSLTNKYTRWTSIAAESEQIRLKNGTTIKTKARTQQKGRRHQQNSQRGVEHCSRQLEQTTPHSLTSEKKNLKTMYLYTYFM